MDKPLQPLIIRKIRLWQRRFFCFIKEIRYSASAFLVLAFRAIHLVAMISWMAGLFYLPRLFVYHVDAIHDETRSTLAIMERRLLHIIIVPASCLTVFSGAWLAFLKNSFYKSYFHGKCICVLGLIVFQYSLSVWRIQISSGTCIHSSRFFRIINEVPTLILISIIILVTFKPFS